MDISGNTQMLEPVQVDASFFLCNTLYSLFADWVSSVVFSENMFSKGNNDLLICQALLFASLIAAVDPVAVLAIFEEIKVKFRFS